VDAGLIDCDARSVFFDGCGLEPTEADITLEAGEYFLDTSNPANLVGGQAGSRPIVTKLVVQLPPFESAPLLTWHVSNFRMRTGSSLRVTGGIALAIVTDGAVTIDGTLDASSHYTIDCTGFGEIGPGAGDGNCEAGGQASKGGSTLAISGGGGGGGGGSVGGDSSLPDGSPIAGGLVFPYEGVIRGGCDGGNGAPLVDCGGAGGSGGGAVLLNAHLNIQLGEEAMIMAGGAGGHGGSTGAAGLGGGGGGGGSGGLIVLESNEVMIDIKSQVLANGGGGGEGSPMEGGTGVQGQDAEGNAAALGGGAGSGGIGGNGAFNMMDAMGGSVADNLGGTGGGGGGVGHIVILATETDIPATALIFPPPKYPE
jgi:hypothetical protein